MNRRDCLCETIRMYLNQGMRRLFVPRALADVLPEGTNLPGLILDKVKRAELSGELVELCNQIKNENPNVDLHAAIDRCLGLDAGLQRPRWYDERMPRREPLLDRENLRAALYDVIEKDPNDNRLMLVRGDQPGKTYSQHLIRHVTEQLGLEPPVFVDLLEMDSPQRFADRLVDRIGIPYGTLAARFSTPIREGSYFNDWLVGQSRTFGANARWLIVLDHLAKPGIPQDVSDMAMDLAQRAMAGDLKNVWVIVLDFPAGDAIDLSAYSEVTIEPLPKETIQQFLDWAVELRRMAGDPDPQVPQSINDTLALAFPLQKAELDGLRRGIKDWLKRRPGAGTPAQ